MPNIAKETKEKKSKEGREETNALLRRLNDDIAALRGDVETLKAGRVPSAPMATFPALLADTFPAVSEEAVARLGYAFASVPKVTIVRVLLADGPQTSAQIGDKAGLTTGSLYHHLRELVHAGVIAPHTRGLHTITPLGQQVAHFLFQAAAPSE